PLMTASTSSVPGHLPVEPVPAARKPDLEPLRPSRGTGRRSRRHARRDACDLPGLLPCHVFSPDLESCSRGSQGADTSRGNSRPAPWAIEQHEDGLPVISTRAQRLFIGFSCNPCLVVPAAPSRRNTTCDGGVGTPQGPRTLLERVCGSRAAGSAGGAG